MKNSKRIIAILLSVFMLISLATGCTSKEPAKSPEPTSSEASGKEKLNGYDLDGVTIDFWNFITGDDNPCLTRWVDKYNAENPYGIVIKQDSMAGEVLLQKLPVALASGTGPQMTLCGLDLPSYADQGLILPLDDIFKYTDLKKDDFIDGLLDITSYEGKIYGIPFYIGVTFMFWNKDLYRQAGLDPEKPPRTWDELRAYSEAIDKLGDNIWGLNFSYGLGYSVFDVMGSYGGKIVTLDEKGLYKNELMSEANIGALKLWSSFYEDGLNPVDGTDELFYAGIVGTTIGGPWVGGTARDEYDLDVGFGLAPGSDEATMYYCACMNMNITKIATEEEIMACYDWMAYWNQVEPCVDFSIDNHAPPYLKAAIADERIQSNKELASMSDFTGRTAWNWIPAGFTHGGEVYELMCDMLEAIALGGDVEESLKKCSGYVDEVLSRANEERIAAGKATK